MDYLFETARLRVRKFVVADVERIFSHHLEQGVKLWIPSECYKDIEEAINVINYYISTTESKILPMVLAVELKETHELIGDTGINEIDGKPGLVEIAYTISDKYSNHGYATELLSGMTEYVFKTFGFDKIYGRVMRGNIISTKVLEKNGYVYIGEEFDAIDDYNGNGILMYVKENNN